MPISLKDVEAAQSTIQDHVQKTQLSYSRSASEWLGANTYLKCENEQTTGSFKIRGALNKIMSLSEEERSRGIVASSAGNHAQGVAYSATKVGAKAHIVMPIHSPIVKATATQSYGAEVILHGEIYDESYAHARDLEKEKGYIFVHPYNDPLVMAGQGTIGLEILEQCSDLDSIVIPIGGGGLVSGIATAIKAIRPECKIYGVVSENAPGVYRLFKGQSMKSIPKRPTIADGIAIKSPSPEIVNEYITRLVDDIVTVEDDEVAEAMVFLLERAKTVVEGSGAAALAGAAKAGWKLGEKTCVLLSGGNIDLNAVSKVIEKGLSRRGRLARLTVVVGDRPGALNRLTKVMSAKRANIIEVKHDRLRAGLRLSETAIEFLVETRSEEHVKEIHAALEATGAEVIS